MLLSLFFFVPVRLSSVLGFTSLFLQYRIHLHAAQPLSVLILCLADVPVLRPQTTRNIEYQVHRTRRSAPKPFVLYYFFHEVRTIYV